MLSKIFHCFYKWNRWYKFKNRIRKKLPAYHPVTGQPLDWDIRILFRNSYYDMQTGKIGGFPYLHIKQISPKGMRVDDRIYEFSWKKKQIINTFGSWEKTYYRGNRL